MGRDRRVLGLGLGGSGEGVLCPFNSLSVDFKGDLFRLRSVHRHSASLSTRNNENMGVSMSAWREASIG